MSLARRGGLARPAAGRREGPPGPGLRLFFWFHRLRRSTFGRGRPSIGLRVLRYLAFGVVVVAGSWVALVVATLVGGLKGFLLALGAIPLAFALAILTASRTGRTSAPPLFEDVPLSTRLISLAERYGGELTVNQTAAALGLSYETSEAGLDDLARKGACDLVVSDEGLMLYRFPDFRRARSRPAPGNHP